VSTVYVNYMIARDVDGLKLLNVTRHRNMKTMVDVESAMNHFDCVVEPHLRYSANTRHCQCVHVFTRYNYLCYAETVYCLVIICELSLVS